MGLTETIKQATISELKNMNLHYFPFYLRDNKTIICLLHENRILDDKSIERALESAVISCAKKDYEFIVKKNAYPDHVGRPECLVYAIQHGTFSRKQLKKIHFDHNETSETFCQRYGKDNLLASLREELLSSEK